VQNSPNCTAYYLTAKVSNGGENIKICSHYKGTRDISGMSVIEVELLSGFTPLPATLNSRAGNVAKKVFTFYFKSFDL